MEPAWTTTVQGKRADTAFRDIFALKDNLARIELKWGSVIVDVSRQGCLLRVYRSNSPEYVRRVQINAARIIYARRVRRILTDHNQAEIVTYILGIESGQNRAICIYVEVADDGYWRCIRDGKVIAQRKARA